MFCLDEPDPHPAFTAAKLPDARVRRALRRPAHPVRAARSERVADRGGRALPRRGGRAGSSSIPAHSASMPPTTASAGVRARRGAPRADPDPRRARPTPDRRRARPLVDRHPVGTLIIAHAGIADLGHLPSRWLGRKNGVSSTPPPGALIDLLDLLPARPAGAGPVRSDFPTGSSPGRFFIALRASFRAGSTSAVRGDARRQREPARRRRGAAGADETGRSAPRSSSRSQLARIHLYLSQAIPFVWICGQQTTIGALGLALNRREPTASPRRPTASPS